MSERIATPERKKSQDAFLEAISTLPASGKVELVQMRGDVRLVAQVTVMPQFREEMLPALQALQQQGFATVEKPQEHGVSDFYIAKEQALAEQAAAFVDARHFGQLMGYPPHAIESHIAREEMMSDEDIEQLIGFPNYIFTSPKFSKAHPEEAKEYLQKSYALLLNEAPDVLEERLPIMENREDHITKIAEFVHGGSKDEAK
jgi:hypothetical protein